MEIACPPDCPYLVSSRAHPAAAVAKQQRRDAEFAVGLLENLSERAYRLLLMFQSVAKRYRTAAIPPLIDAEVADAAATFAATLETADKGIIYEHTASSITSQRLVAEFGQALAALERATGPRGGRDAIVALRTLERGARSAAKLLDGGDIAFLKFLDRLPDVMGSPEGPESGVIVPGDVDEQPTTREPASERPRIILP